MAQCAVVRRPVERCRGGWLAPGRPDAIAVERPLEIRFEGISLARTRTPGCDEALALGALFGEGLVESARGLRVRQDAGSSGADTVTVERAATRRRSVAPAEIVPFEAWVERGRPLEDDRRIALGLVPACILRLQRLQPGFERTGSLHAAGAFDSKGAPLAVAEDIGRHNAVDKVVGQLLSRGLLGRASLLALSGRIGGDLVQKAWRAAIPVVAGISAPTSMAIELASRWRICLAGFVRQGGFNLYACSWRLEPGARRAGASGGRRMAQGSR
jgi:FdhD protein